MKLPKNEHSTYLGDILLPSELLLLLFDEEFALYPHFWIRLERRDTQRFCSSGVEANRSISRAL